MQILLATAEHVFSDLIELQVSLLGHHAQCVKSDAELLSSLKDSDYSLAIIDTALPGRHVRDTLTEIRGRWCPDHLSILMISTNESTELLEQVFRCGADHWLPAPFDPQEFRGKLESILDDCHASHLCIA